MDTLSGEIGESSGVSRPYTNMFKGKEIGKFRVSCGGRLVIPNNWANSIFAWILILFPSIMQMAYVNPLFLNLKPLIDTLYCLTMLLSLIFLFKTTFTDPGIIPRADPVKSK